MISKLLENVIEIPKWQMKIQSRLSFASTLFVKAFTKLHHISSGIENHKTNHFWKMKSQMRVLLFLAITAGTDSSMV